MELKKQKLEDPLKCFTSIVTLKFYMLSTEEHQIAENFMSVRVKNVPHHHPQQVTGYLVDVTLFSACISLNSLKSKDRVKRQESSTYNKYLSKRWGFTV